MTVFRATPSRLVSAVAKRWRRLAGPLLVVAFAGVAFAAFSVTSDSAQAQSATAVGASTTTTAVLKPGQQLFVEHCASCHGVNAQGTERAPSLWTAGAAGVNFYLSTGRMPLNNAKAQPLDHTPFFTPKQIDEITQFVIGEGKSRGKSGPAIPTVQPLCHNQDSAGLNEKSCVTLSEGRYLYTLNCAACHNAQGSGGMLAGGMTVPPVLHATKTQIAEAPRVGPRPMPKFGEGQLNENQLSAIVHYVKYLQHPEDHGGMPIGHFGPLGEGFVGILLGFGSLLLIVRLMGTRG